MYEIQNPAAATIKQDRCKSTYFRVHLLKITRKRLIMVKNLKLLKIYGPHNLFSCISANVEMILISEFESPI